MVAIPESRLDLMQFGMFIKRDGLECHVAPIIAKKLKIPSE